VPEYFTLDELRALPQLSDTGIYPDDRCEAAAAWAVALIEREVGSSFILREYTEVYDGGCSEVFLRRAYAVTDPAPTATENGVSVTDDLRVQYGILRRFSPGSWIPRFWIPGIGNIEITYSAGYTAEPPADLKEAALLLTRLHLLETDSNTSTSARQTQVTNEFGGTTTYAVAGKDRPTGFPAIDAVIVAYRAKLTALWCA
jgi:hypothetical protein